MTQLHVIYLLIICLVVLLPIAFVMGRDWERNYIVTLQDRRQLQPSQFPRPTMEEIGGKRE